MERHAYTKQVLIRGKSCAVSCVDIADQAYVLSRPPVRVARLEDEWYEDVKCPMEVIAALKQSRLADLFTFWQRLPDTVPKYDFYYEYEAIAALPVKSFDQWWTNQIKSRIRNLIRKSEKSGVVVRQAQYDDDFVRGMTEIFNEAPFRQQKKFWHYGKDFETVRAEFSRFLYREDLIGAYYKDKLIGFVMLGNAGNYGVTGQIISRIDHRDKATNNLLIAKAVELCERRNLPYLVYLYWDEGSLSEFKRRSGFQKVLLPRYYIPLTNKGRIALQCGLHNGLNNAIPAGLKNYLKRARSWWCRLSEE